MVAKGLFSHPPRVGIDMHFGRVRIYATPYPISWIIFILESKPGCTDKMLEFRWVQVAPLAWLICFYTATTATKEKNVGSLGHGSRADVGVFGSTSGCLGGLLNIDNILILKAWSIKFVHLNYS